jgi:hypothetical protein
VITTANTSVSGTACVGCLIDIYADAADEGKTWLGATTAD